MPNLLAGAQRALGACLHSRPRRAHVGRGARDHLLCAAFAPDDLAFALAPEYASTLRRHADAAAHKRITSLAFCFGVWPRHRRRRGGLLDRTPVLSSRGSSSANAGPGPERVTSPRLPIRGRLFGAGRKTLAVCKTLRKP